MKNMMRRRNLDGNNPSAYVRFALLFIIGAILGVLLAQVLPQAASNGAIKSLLNFVQKSRAAIFWTVFLKSIAMPAVIFIAAALGASRLTSIAFIVLGVIKSCTVSLCALAQGVQGYFAAVVVYCGTTFLTLVCMLIMSHTVCSDKSPSKMRYGRAVLAPTAPFAMLMCVLICFGVAIIFCFAFPAFASAAQALLN